MDVFALYKTFLSRENIILRIICIVKISYIALMLFLLTLKFSSLGSKNVMRGVKVSYDIFTGGVKISYDIFTGE